MKDKIRQIFLFIYYRKSKIGLFLFSLFAFAFVVAFISTSFNIFPAVAADTSIMIMDMFLSRYFLISLFIFKCTEFYFNAKSNEGLDLSIFAVLILLKPADSIPNFIKFIIVIALFLMSIAGEPKKGYSYK